MANWLRTIGQVWHGNDRILSGATPPKRITVVTCSHRRDAEAYAAQEHRDHPDAGVSISGTQGLWKVRRDVQPDEIRRAA